MRLRFDTRVTLCIVSMVCAEQRERTVTHWFLLFGLTEQRDLSPQPLTQGCSTSLFYLYLQKLVTTIFQAYQDAGLSLPGLLRPREIGLSLPCLSRERFVTTGLLWQVCLSANLIVTDLPLGITLPLVKLDSNSSASRQAW